MNSRRLIGFPPDQGLHATTLPNEGCVVHHSKIARPNVAYGGQNRKSSMRAHVFRFAPDSGHCAVQSACPFRAAKSRRATLAFRGCYSLGAKRRNALKPPCEAPGAGSTFHRNNQPRSWSSDRTNVVAKGLL